MVASIQLTITAYESENESWFWQFLVIALFQAITFFLLHHIDKVTGARPIFSNALMLFSIWFLIFMIVTEL